MPPRFYLCTYAPLAIKPHGQIAANKHKLPPLIDGSIRREPDLLHAYPAITCLCRGKQFAPRLRVDDVVGYITKKARYHIERPHTRLTALLRVMEVLDSHEKGAAWYRERDLLLPNNCMVAGNEAMPLELSHKKHPAIKELGEDAGYRKWAAIYRLRAAACGVFVICEPIYVNLQFKAPEISPDVFHRVFGGMPGTENPGAHSMTIGRALVEELGIDAKL